MAPRARLVAQRRRAPLSAIAAIIAAVAYVAYVQLGAMDLVDKAEGPQAPAEFSAGSDSVAEDAAEPAVASGGSRALAAQASLAAAAAGPLSHFTCEVITDDTTAVLCEHEGMVVSWKLVEGACVRRQLLVATAGVRGDSNESRARKTSSTRLLRMRAAAWTRLRLEAYAFFFPGFSPRSSLLPVNTTVLPWASVPGMASAQQRVALRVTTAWAWQYEGRFDVLLNGTSVCSLAQELRAVQDGPARSSWWPNALAMPDSLILAAGPRELSSSSFWDLVWRRSSAQGALIRVSWCIRPLLRPMGQALCARPWVTPQRLREGMVSAQQALFSRPASMQLHDVQEVRRLLPLSHSQVALNTALLSAVRDFNGSRGSMASVNAAFNPPVALGAAGAFMVAYNMVVTQHGGLQPLEKEDKKKKKKSKQLRGVRAPMNGRSPKRHHFMYHTTCEGEKVDPIPARFIKHLPEVAEVVVLTHRLEYNIYHWITESIGKAAPMLDYLRANPHVRLHVGMISNKKRQAMATFRQEQLQLLGFDWRSRVVKGYVRARIVHYVDNHECSYPHGQWVQLLRERFRRALQLDNPPLQLERMPGRLLPSPAPAAAPLPGGRANASGAPAAEAPRPMRIVALRRGFSRVITNEPALLRRVAASLGPAAVIHEIRDWQMPSQVDLLRTIGEADAIIGPHGAGQTNAIVARPGTCLIEFIPSDWFVMCYWRMSGNLDLDYNRFVTKGDRYAPFSISVPRAVAALRRCLGLPPENASTAALEDDVPAPGGVGAEAPRMRKTEAAAAKPVAKIRKRKVGKRARS